MKSRQAFEGYLTESVKQRIVQSGHPQEEALFLLDTFCAASFFCCGVIERNISTTNSINRIVSRLQRIRDKIEDSKRKPQSENDGFIQG
jgi:hypothetical protein